MGARKLLCVLVCEGKDYRFLATLLRRAIDQICTALAGFFVEVEVRHVDADPQRPSQMLAALECVGKFDVLLYHHDGAPSSTADAKIAEVRMAMTRVRAEPMVAVVPVRETEAWILADHQVLAAWLGIRAAEVSAIVPMPGRELERILDPKAALASVIGLASRRGKAKVDRTFMFSDLAEGVELDLLRRVPSFAQWWTDMTEALATLGYK